MNSRIVAVMSRVVAVAFGLVWGFFVAFNVVFSDIFGVNDMLVAIVYVLAAYFILGLAFGALGPKTGWKWTWWIAPPGVILAALMIADNPDRVLYVAGVMASVVVATLGGTWLGAYLRGTLARRHASASGLGTPPN